MSRDAARTSPYLPSATVRAEVPRRGRFGPSALLTPANLLTVTRIAAAPALAVLVIATGPSSWLLVGLWFVLASSDGADGFVARRQGATRSGAFLDPLADKFLVLAALAGLAAIDEVSVIPVVIIALREVGMSAYRSVAGRRGISIPARRSAKAKTLLQDLAVGLAFLPLVGRDHRSVVSAVLWLAVALTLFSGVQYLRDGRRLTKTAALS